MKEKILIFLKRRFPILWRVIEEMNLFLIRLLFGKRLEELKEKHAQFTELDQYRIRLLQSKDIEVLYEFLSEQDLDQFTFFRPHDFNRKALLRVLRKDLFLPFGVFSDENLAGYCFLRLFFNRTAFIGRIVSPLFQGKGIGQKMGSFLLSVADTLNFKMYSTISKKNLASLKSHQKNNNLVIERELQNGFVLIRFVSKSKEN